MSFSIPFTLEEWLNKKTDTIRYEDWFKEDIFLHMKRKKITNKSKAVHSFFLSLKNEIEEYKQALTSEKLKVQSSNEPSIDCIYSVEPNQCLKDWLKKSQIRKITPSICSKCTELRHEQKQLEKINRAKSRKLNNRTTSLITRKPTKIHCVGLHKLIDPLKNQAVCTNCKIKTFKTWAECKQKQFSSI